MSDIAVMERVYARVRLVRGMGSRRKGRLCVMSFVALLAGERHTDAPTTSSPFIRTLAVYLNDAMPDLERQRLKPFAPRILGTNDGLDRERAEVALGVLTAEIVPRFYADIAAGRTSAPANSQSPQQFVSAFLSPNSSGFLASDADCIATAAGRLLVFCATMAPKSADRGWYWLKAIDLLDRLCDVGPSKGASCPSPAQVEFAACTLDRLSPLSRLGARLGAIFRRMWRRATGDLAIAEAPDMPLRERPHVPSRGDAAFPSSSAAPSPSERSLVKMGR